MNGFKVQYNDVNQGRCGPCGDEWQLPQPRPNEEGGQYARGIIGEKYYAGDVNLKTKFILNETLIIEFGFQVVNLVVFLTVSDYSGYFEFRLCADKTEAGQIITQECFDRHLLQLADESGATRYYVQPAGSNTFHNVSVVLPYEGANCKYCVIQWRYRTGHFIRNQFI